MSQASPPITAEADFDFETPTRTRASNPAASSPTTSILNGAKGQTKASSPALQTLSRWAGLSAAMKGHSQTAAELLMHQAATAAQTEELVKQLLWEAKVHEEEKQRLEAQILQDRADFTSQAKLLSQHFTMAHHRNTALQVAHEAQQAEVRGIKEDRESAVQEVQALRQKVDQLLNELAQERTLRAQAEAALQEHGVAIEEMQQEMQHSRSCCEELHAAKAQLQAQVKAMVRAEKELTGNLKLTHNQIDEQLNMLREQLQSERQKRMFANRRKVELVQHVNMLTSQLESYKLALEQATNKGAASPPPALPVAVELRQQALRSAKLPASLRSSLMRRKTTIRVAMASAGQGQGLKHQAHYTAAFAPPASKPVRQTPDARALRPAATATPSPPLSSRSQAAGPAEMSGFASPASAHHAAPPIKLTAVKVLMNQLGQAEDTTAPSTPLDVEPRAGASDERQ